LIHSVDDPTVTVVRLKERRSYMVDEEQQQAVQNEQPEPQVPEDTTRPVSSPVAAADPNDQQDKDKFFKDVDSVDSTSTPSDQEGGDVTEDKKPSRIEKRFDKFTSMLKEQAQPQQPALSQVFGNDPLFTQEELETGSIDPASLQQRLLQREMQSEERIKQQVRADLEYRSTVQDHLADIEKVSEEIAADPAIEKLVSKQYDALNKMTDPRTGQEVFVPRVKMSEIYQEFKEALDKKTTAATADVQARVNAQANMQAVPPSVTNASTHDLEGQAALDKAMQTGRDEDWAEVLKRRI
jgi:hypothetical protein